MTELERLLKSELDKRERYFLNELKKYTSSYEKNLELIQSKYQQIVEDQKIIIDQQSQTLTQYGQISSDLRVSLDHEQLQSLTELNERLDALERSDSDLVQQLNAVLAKL